MATLLMYLHSNIYKSIESFHNNEFLFKPGMRGGIGIKPNLIGMRTLFNISPDRTNQPLGLQSITRFGSQLSCNSILSYYTRIRVS